MKDEIVGTRIGIYDVLYECDYKTNDGHKLYHVKCSICGWETDKLKSHIGIATICRHPKKEIGIEIKKCLNCGQDIPINYDKLSEYKNRKFCCISCATTYNNSNRVKNRKVIRDNRNIKNNKSKNNDKDNKIIEKQNELFCLNCNAPLKSSYQIKYCNSKCQQEHQQKQWEDKWLSGEINGFSETNHWGTVPKRIRRYLFKKYNSKCARCGWGEINPYSNKVPLEVEHIDGDYKNNRPENLTLLCPNCHSLTRTYRGLNVGHGRGKTWTPIPDEDIVI